MRTAFGKRPASSRRLRRGTRNHRHLHTFRHAFISNAITKGTPEAVVRDWVGHVDADILKLYTHIADQDSQAAMRRLAEANTKQMKDKRPATPRKTLKAI